MKQERIIKSGFRSMFRNKLQTFFMTLGIILGTLAIIVSMSFGESSKKKIMADINKLFGSSNILVAAGGGGMMGGGNGSTKLTIEDIEALVDEIPGVIAWDPVQTESAKDVSYQGKSVVAILMSGGINCSEVWQREAIEGEFFDEEDVQVAAKVAVIGTKVAIDLFGEENPIGRQFKIDGIPFKVKGILEEFGTDPHGMDRDYDVYIPISTMQRRVMNVDYIAYAKLAFTDASQLEEKVGHITEILRERHSITSGEPNNFAVVSPAAVHEMVDAMNRTFTLFIPLIAAISIIVGGIVIAVLMLISVKKRKIEIGLRKAIGARSKDIFKQFVIESTVVSIAGGTIGLILGVGGIAIISSIEGGFPLIISPMALTIAVVIPILMGVLAGTIPAKKAANQDPIENLQG